MVETWNLDVRDGLSGAFHLAKCLCWLETCSFSRSGSSTHIHPLVDKLTIVDVPALTILTVTWFISFFFLGLMSDSGFSEVVQIVY